LKLGQSRKEVLACSGHERDAFSVSIDLPKGRKLRRVTTYI